MGEWEAGGQVAMLLGVFGFFTAVQATIINEYEGRAPWRLAFHPPYVFACVMFLLGYTGYIFVAVSLGEGLRVLLGSAFYFFILATVIQWIKADKIAAFVGFFACPVLAIWLISLA